MSDKDKIAMPVSREDQTKLWDECWSDALEEQKEYAYTLAMTQVFFAYRIQFVSDGLLEEITNEELGELLEDGS